MNPGATTLPVASIVRPACSVSGSSVRRSRPSRISTRAWAPERPPSRRRSCRQRCGSRARSSSALGRAFEASTYAGLRGSLHEPIVGGVIDRPRPGARCVPNVAQEAAGLLGERRPPMSGSPQEPAIPGDGPSGTGTRRRRPTFDVWNSWRTGSRWAPLGAQASRLRRSPDKHRVGRYRAMATSERPAQRADRLADEAVVTIGRQIRLARVGHGLSQRSLEAATGLSHGEISRIERGRVPDVPLRSLIQIAAAVGLALPARCFPAGDAIRDAGHARLLARFRNEIHPSLRWRTEVPLPIPGDLRSWDALAGGANLAHRDRGRDGHRRHTGARTETDAETPRRRDHNVILLVADTPRNRAALASSPAAFSDLPMRTRTILAAMRAGRDPGGSGIVII